MIFILDESLTIGNPNFTGTLSGDDNVSILPVRPFRENDEISPLIVTKKGISENLKEKVKIYDDFGTWDIKEGKEELELLLTCIPTAQFSITVAYTRETDTIKVVLDAEDEKIINHDGSLSDLANELDRKNIQVKVAPRLNKDKGDYDVSSIFNKDFEFTTTFGSLTVHSRQKYNTYDVDYLVALFTDAVKEKCSYIATNGVENRELIEVLDTIAKRNNILLVVDVESIVDVKRGRFSFLQSKNIKILNPNNEKLSLPWCKLAFQRDNSSPSNGLLQVGAYRIMGRRLPIDVDADIKQTIYSVNEKKYIRDNNLIYVAKRFNVAFFENTDGFKDNIELYIKRFIRGIVESHKGGNQIIAKVEISKEIEKFFSDGAYLGFFVGLKKPSYTLIDNGEFVDVEVDFK